MAVEQQAPVRTELGARVGRGRQLTAGGTSGNERLTAATGAVLLALLAVIGVTIIQLRQLLSVHLFVGMLLIGPVALKLATTGYRFVRYYTSSPSYRREGPPPAALRAIAPVVVLSTVVALASGVALLFAGPTARDSLLPIHKVSFIVWGAFTGLHVLGHLPGLQRTVKADYGRSTGWGEELPGRSGRMLSLAAAITAGAVLAVLVLPEFGAWLHGGATHHRG